MYMSHYTSSLTSRSEKCTKLLFKNEYSFYITTVALKVRYDMFGKHIFIRRMVEVKGENQINVTMFDEFELSLFVIVIHMANSSLCIAL